MANTISYAVVTLIVTLGLTSIYFYLYLQERERCMAIWSASWAMFALRLVFQIGAFYSSQTAALTVAEQLANYASGILLLWGTLDFLGRPLNLRWAVVAVLWPAWIVASAFLSLPLEAQILPTYLLIGVFYIWTGTVLLRAPLPAGMGKLLTGWGFVIAGIHKFDYPLVRPLAWLVPWGYLLASLLHMTMGVGMLLVYFERNRAELRRRENRLQESELRFRLLYQNAPIGYQSLDENGCLIEVNQAWLEELGYTREEALGRGFADFLAPEFQALFPHRFEQFKAAGAVQCVEFEMVRKDGSRLAAAFDGRIARDDRGRFLQTHCVLHNVTERKRAQAAVERKTAQLEQLLDMSRRLASSLEFEAVLEQICLSARDIVEADGCAIYRLEADGETLTPLVASDPLWQAEILATPLQVGNSFTGQALAARRPQIWNNASQYSVGYQIPGTPVDEDEHILAAPFLVDDHVLGAICLDRTGARPFDSADLALADTFAAFAALAFKNAQAHADLQREVAERRLAENRLLESEARYRSLFEDSPISIWEEDFSALKTHLDGLRAAGVTNLRAYFDSNLHVLPEILAKIRVLDINRATLAQYGAESKADLIGALEQVVGIREVYTTQKESLLAVADGLTSFEIETTNLTLSGDMIRINLRWSVAPGYEKTYGKVIVTILDITERKLAEAATQQALAALQASEADLRRSQAELSESEARYRSLFEGSQSVLLLIDPAGGRIVDANPAALRYYGYPRQVMLSMSLAELDLSPVEAVFHELQQAACGQRAHIQRQHRLAGGQVRIVEADVGAILLDGRRLLYHTIHDITDRVQREREMEMLAKVTAALRPAASRAEMLPVILDQVRDLLDAQGVALLLQDPAKDELVFELTVGTASGLTGLRLPPGAGIGGLVISTGVPYLNNDVNADPRNLQVDQAPNPRALQAVPLSINGKTTGALMTSRDEPFSEADLRLLAAVCDIAASALHRQSLTDQTLKHAGDMAAVSELGRSLSATLDLEQVYIRLAEAVPRLVPDVATLFISRYDAGRGQIRAAFGIADGERIDAATLPVFTLAPAGEGAQSEVIRTRRPLIINNLPEWGDRCAPAGKGIQSAVYVPLLARDQILGVFQVQSYVANRFTQADADLLTIVGNTAAIAIQNADLFAETGQRLHRLDALHNIDKAITTHQDLDLTLQVVLEQVTGQLGVDAATVLLLEPPGQALILKGSCGFHAGLLPRRAIPLGKGLAGQVALQRKLLEIRNLGAITDPGSALAASQSTFANLLSEGFVAYYGVPLIARGQVKGVLELFHRGELDPDGEWLNFLDTLARQAAIAVDNAGLISDLQRSNQELILTFDTTLEGWASALELRDLETKNHSKRVVELSVQLARALGVRGEALVHLRRGALLHDIGKLGLPDHILNKPGPLTEEEWEVMRQHPVHAYKLLAPIPFLHPALEVAYNHHEKWDGSGYPRGLKGEAIPLAARIFAVVDVWDALLDDRPYRRAWTEDAARAYLREQAGAHFDPQVAAAFLAL